MKAMIFAAGLGTRLRPLTDNKPKALVEVGGVPMLERVILNLKAAGADEIVVNIHHFGQQIINFLDANANFGVEIRVSDERGSLLDTGGGIRKAMDWLSGDEPFFVHNADVVTDLPLRDIYDYHLRHSADATLLADTRSTSRYLLCDADSRLRGWTNKATGEYRPAGFDPAAGDYKELAYGCVQVVSSSTLARLADRPEGSKFSIIDFYLAECSTLKIQCFKPSAPYAWFDIGTPQKLAQAEAWLAAR